MIGPEIIDWIIYLFARWIGRPLQRVRAKRLMGEGRLMCRLSSPSATAVLSPQRPPVVPMNSLAGAAEISHRSLRLKGMKFSISAIEQPGRQGPEEKGGSSDLMFSPPSRIFTLHVNGGTVDWTVLDWQAEWAVSQLGFDYQSSGRS